jgi:integrase
MQKKRKVKDEPINLSEQFLTDLYQTVQKAEWPYKTNTHQLQQRDKALISFLILTGVRNSETQTITKKQIHNNKTHLQITRIKTLKKGNEREKVILPKIGGLAPFTQTFETWLNQIPNQDSILFPSANIDGSLNWKQPLSRQRIHYMIKTTTGKFPHWYRGVCETIYGKYFFENDIYALQTFMGIKNINSLTPYVDGHWERYTKNILNAKIT